MSINAPNRERLAALVGNAKLPSHLANVTVAVNEIRRIWKLVKTCQVSVPCEDYPSVHRRRATGVRPPKTWEIKLAAINDIIGGFGIESMETANTGEYAEFTNTGDSYTPTVMYWRGRLSLCDGGIGGFIESSKVKFK